MSEQSAESDRRIAQRRRVLKGGMIAFNDRHSTLPCRVRNISETGAQLEFEPSAIVAVPEAFDLVIELDAVSVPCRVARRQGQVVGVHFEGPFSKVAQTRAQIVRPTSPGSQPSLRKKPIT